MLIHCLNIHEDEDLSCSMSSYFKGRPENIPWNKDESTIPKRISSWIDSSKLDSGAIVQQSRYFGHHKQLSWKGVNKEQLEKNVRVNGFLYGALNSKESNSSMELSLTKLRILK